MAETYDPAKAIEFAAEFWDRPCRSDKHPLAVGLDSALDAPLSLFWDAKKHPDMEPRFVFNQMMGRDQLMAVPKAGTKTTAQPFVILGTEKDIKTGRMLEDCAHFLSQALKVGGLKIQDQWAVPLLVNVLRAGEDGTPRPRAKTLAEKASREAAQRLIDDDLLVPGDMIGYFNDGGYSHCAMYTGKYKGVGRVTCHTKSRFAGKTPPGVTDDWFLVNPKYTFTLMHIPGSAEAAPTRGQAVSGWWRVVHWWSGAPAGKDFEYYYLYADGRALSTFRTPQSNGAPLAPAAGDSRGYWFQIGGKIKIAWRKNGGVTVMDVPGCQATVDVIVDGLFRSYARRFTV